MTAHESSSEMVCWELRGVQSCCSQQSRALSAQNTSHRTTRLTTTTTTQQYTTTAIPHSQSKALKSSLK